MAAMAISFRGLSYEKLRVTSTTSSGGAEMRLGIAGHALGAPPRVVASEHSAEPARRSGLGKSVVDEDAKQRRVALRHQVEAHPVVAYHDEPGHARRFPHLSPRRISFCDDFLERERNPEYSAAHADRCAHRTALRRIQLKRHPRPGHHPRGTAHVSREESGIVEAREHRVGGSVHRHAALEVKWKR